MVEVLRAHGLAKGILSIDKNAGERLQACVSSSLDKLPPSDRLALAILTLFPNKFDVTAAAAVLKTSKLSAIQCLTRLQLKSWVKAVSEASDTGSADIADEQYQLHLLVRGTAANGYCSHVEYLGAQQAFIEYYLAMLHAAEPEYTDTGMAALQQLRLQRLNLVTALQQLAVQEPLVPLHDFKRHCHLSLFALRGLAGLRIDTHTTVQAMRKLLYWAGASSDPEAVVGARQQLGFVLASMPEHWPEAEHELTAALSSQQSIDEQDHPSSVVALSGLAALMSAKACDGVDADVSQQRAVSYAQQLYQVLCSHKGKSDPEAVLCAIELAQYLPHAMDRWRWLEQSFLSAEQDLGGQHPVVLRLKYEQLKLKAGSDYLEVKDDIPKLRQSLESCTEQRSVKDSLTIHALICLGRALVRSQHAEEQQEGLKHLHEAIQAMAATYSKEDKEVLAAQLEHVVPSLIWVQQADDATQLLSKLQPMFEQTFGASSLVVINLLRQHAAACYAKDEYSKGESFLRKAVSRARTLVQALTVSEQTSFVVKQGLHMELASNLEEQGRCVVTCLVFT